MKIHLTVLFAALVTTTVAAADPRELQWPDLVPPQAPYDDPFKKLSPNQLGDVGLVARLRDYQAAGKPPSERLERLATAALADLTAAGVDVDALFAQTAEVNRIRRERAEATDTSLDGQAVRIPGFLLPLEYDGTQVVEFLLVPYVGACIHVPPPPPNQMVLVKLDEGYDNNGKLFTPIWVSGRLRTERSDQELSLVDGSAPVGVGYAMEQAAVEPYTED